MCEYIGGPPCGPVWCPCDYLYWEDTGLGRGLGRATTVMFLDDPELSEDDSIGCAA